MNFLGIDIGGTFIKYGIVENIRKIVLENKIQTANNLKGLINQIVDIIKKHKYKPGVEAGGIGIAGFIRKKDKCIVKSPNLLFLNGVFFETVIKENTDIPVFVDNDANLCALGEYWFLIEPRPASLVNITLGTGIGGGIILQGEIWHGEGGFAAELGHVIVNPDGRLCNCGNRGCFETESSATAIINHYKELSGKEMESALEIFKLYEKGEKFAIQSFNRAGYYLGIFLTTLINMLNPAVISIGGGVAAAGDAFFKPALAELKARVNSDFLLSTEIKISDHESQAGIIGAAKFAQEKLKGRR